MSDSRFKVCDSSSAATNSSYDLIPGKLYMPGLLNISINIRGPLQINFYETCRSCTDYLVWLRK